LPGKKLLLLFLLLSASSCVQGGFRHYEPIEDWLPSLKDQEFLGSIPGDNILYNDPKSEDLVCFRALDFTKHEAECHAK
jgi:hypothetical protein